jgi:hypothetical protein
MGSVVISGATSGAITLAVPAEAGTHTVTIPAADRRALGYTFWYTDVVPTNCCAYRVDKRYYSRN